MQVNEQLGQNSECLVLDLAVHVVTTGFKRETFSPFRSPKTHNIKTDYERTKIYEKSWIQVAQIGVQKQALVIIAIGLPVRRKCLILTAS